MSGGGAAPSGHGSMVLPAQAGTCNDEGAPRIGKTSPGQADRGHREVTVRFGPAIGHNIAKDGADIAPLLGAEGRGRAQFRKEQKPRFVGA
jgi:hypothetical protein